MKIATIDIEGDGLSKDLNQKLFKNGGHYDPDTRLWCITFTDDKGTDTYVCKLPPIPRPGRKAYHEVATKVPNEINGHKITEVTDYWSFLDTIYLLLKRYKLSGYKICFKGYGKYNYDKDMLEIIFKKFNIDTDILDCLINAHKSTVGRWKETDKQIHTGIRIPNQEYIINGIKHNIEDSIQLYNLVMEYVQRTAN